MDAHLAHAADAARVSDTSAAPQQSSHNAYPRSALLYALAMVALLLFTHFTTATDYVGQDNDDVMRLIEVRDLLNGQGWFDMMQYRLGLDGGTLMHWSRFVDLPIALLIRLFGLFAGPQQAEALALTVWPLALSAIIVPLMGWAAFRLGGRVAKHFASGMTIFFVFGMGRFTPGSADHHNLQLVFAALLLAMLSDPLQRRSSLAVAGFAAGMEIAIGAEAAPLVATASAIVALLWAWHGRARAAQAAAYAFAFLLTVSAAFFLTTPPHLYGLVTCDNLSLGFFGLAATGSFLLLAQTQALSGLPRPVRFASLAVSGIALLAVARILAPQCLGNPLASLDPMLKELWLDKVMEAHSVFAPLRLQPETVGGFYAVGLLALGASLVRIWRGERTELHAVLAGLVGVSLAIAMMQVRGAMFSNMLSILPLSLVVADLRAWQGRKPGSPGRNAAYLATALASLPLVWSVVGLAVVKGPSGLSEQVDTVATRAGPLCASPEALAPLARMPRGVVLAPSDLGVHVLRYTPHRVLSAPYHRDQGGMLTELNTGLAMPDEAVAFLRGAKVDYVLFCARENQTRSLAHLKPEGFYGRLTAGDVPAYLTPIDTPPRGALRIYKVSAN